MIIGLIPAAGHARRLGIQSSSKEMLAVRGRPMIDHLVERLKVVEPDELRVVTRPEKRDVTEHAESLGATVVHGHPQEVSASVRLGLKGLADHDEILLGFPDTLWEPVDGFAQLLTLVRDGTTEVAVGLFRLAEGLERSDVVTLEAGGRVAGIQVKPQQPASDLIWGIAAARVRVLRALPADADLGAYFDTLARRRAVRGVVLSGPWLDVGTPEALERARRA